MPDSWNNDPQRPVFVDGEYHCCFLRGGNALVIGEALVDATAMRRLDATAGVESRHMAAASIRFDPRTAEFRGFSGFIDPSRSG